MINYQSLPVGLNVDFQNYFIPAGAMSVGVNSFLFDSTSTFSVGANNYANRIDNGFNCCPLQFMVFNDSTGNFTQCFFYNGTSDFNSTVDFETRRWTLLMPLDKTKGNHTHVDTLNFNLELRFTVGVVGDLNIYLLYTYWK